jgi:hypothetical protein
MKLDYSKISNKGDAMAMIAILVLTVAFVWLWRWQSVLISLSPVSSAPLSSGSGTTGFTNLLTSG